MILKATNVTKSFTSGVRQLDVLTGVNLTVNPGEIIAILGTSGSGKSTLLQLLGALDHPTAGRIDIDGAPLSEFNNNELSQFRSKSVGFVFQFHHLLPDFTALENVMMPARIAGCSPEQAQEDARILLAEVGLAERQEHRPSELSGGEQQRVAVARALVNNPGLLLCDEPSGNLDNKTSGELHTLLSRLHDTRGTSIIIVTHDTSLASLAGRQLRLENGILND